MSEVLAELGTPAMLEAMEANFAEEMACFGRALPGAELHEDGEMQWFFTGRPGFNGVLRTHIVTNEPHEIDARIDAALNYFKARHMSMGWLVTPLTRPANLATYLEAHGLIYRRTNREMAVDTQAINETVSTPADLIIHEVEDQEMLNLWRTTTIKGWESTEEAGQVYYDAYSRLGFGKDKPWHHYIGWLHDEPVATASLLLHSGIAGIYGVATIPKARRQGIGAAMTFYALREAGALQYRVAILSPSEMGIGIYRRLGFQEYYKTQFYTWSPE